MLRWKRQRRGVAEVLSAAVVCGTVAAALTHGDFESMKALGWIGLAGTFVLLTIGSVLRPWHRTQTVGSLVVRTGSAVFLAIPIAWMAARAVVNVDIWRAKRYVAAELAPHLEQTRRSNGRYPVELRLWEELPPAAPWLLRRFHYRSDGRAYALWVMDPGLCGRITSYSSTTSRWTETYDRVGTEGKQRPTLRLQLPLATDPAYASVSSSMRAALRGVTSCTAPSSSRKYGTAGSNGDVSRRPSSL